MSEQNISEPKTIASGSKVKDPRRVVAGKRLAAISRQAKENKALRLKQQSDNHDLESSGTILYLVGGLVVVGAVSYLLFANQEKVVRTLTGDKKESDPTPTAPTEPPKREKSKRILMINK